MWLCSSLFIPWSLVVSYLYWLAPQHIQISERDCVLKTISFLFVAPKTNFVQVCVSFSQCLSSCGVSCAESVEAISVYPMPVLRCVLSLPFSRPLLPYQACISLHYIIVVELWLCHAVQWLFVTDSAWNYGCSMPRWKKVESIRHRHLVN